MEALINKGCLLHCAFINILFQNREIRHNFHNFEQKATPLGDYRFPCGVAFSLP